jgi:hypothetical protein
VRADQPEDNVERVRVVASTVKKNGAAGKWLERSFGVARTAEYQRLLWNEA